MECETFWVPCCDSHWKRKAKQKFMSQNYKMIIQYEGTRYDGWQKQGNTENTIQGRMEKVLERMAGFPVEVHGSGRTDAGVHAEGQVANFHLPDGWHVPDAKDSFRLVSGKHLPEADGQKRPANGQQKSAAWICDYLNRYLPDDIAVTELVPVPERFHSRLSAVRKIYTYRVDTAKKRNVFSRRTVYGLGEELNLEAIGRAAALLCGTHDYKSFCGNKKMKKSTVRTIYRIEVKKKPGSSLVELEFEGNGFLQNMVRILTGTLIEVGLGKRDAASMPDILKAMDRQAAGYTAPAEGLCLSEVFYGFTVHG